MMDISLATWPISPVCI